MSPGGQFLLSLDTDIRTADAHYIRADAMKASRTLAELIDALRG